MNNSRETELTLIDSLLTLLRADGSTYTNSPCESQYYETARQLKDFIDEIPGGFLIYRADGDEEIIYANKALVQIFKCSSLSEFRELTGNSFKGVVYPDDFEQVEQSITQQIEISKDNLDYVEYRIRRNDGVIRWVEDYGHFVHSESAGDIYYVFISDATEKITRRIAEKDSLLSEKKKNEQKFKNIIEEYDKERQLIRREHLQRLEVIEGLSVNYDSILYADLDSDKVRPYRLSSRLERQFEKKLQERNLGWFLNDYVKVWVHPDDRERVAEMTSPNYIIKKLSDNPTYYLNYRCIQNDETQYIQLRIVNVGAGKHISQIVMGYRNTDEEILQEMKQKQILAEALKNAKTASVAKNTFLSNMSHDMRTPLNAIFGFAALAEKNISDEKAVRQYLNKIETAGNQILDLINKVLEISYIESHDFRLSQSACNISEIVHEVYESVLPKASAKNISFTLGNTRVAHSSVWADKDKLKQILSHIAGNAVKYTNGGGKASMQVQEQEKILDGFATYAFTVEDTGIGIGKESLERIFEPFEREQNTTLSGIHGTGLGLTIAKQLADTMGGNISVKSELGKGSTFIVTLEFKIGETILPQDSDSANSSAGLKGKKILLVEDNEINLEIETELLEDLGAVVDTAANGQIALDKVKTSAVGEYSFILMDIQMPIMDGIQSTKEIRKLDNPELAQIPIIALSANAFENDKRASLQTGMDAHITKPIDIPRLIKTVTEVLDAHKSK